MPNRIAMGTLNDIGTEELGHLEMVATIVHQLTRNLSMEEIENNYGILHCRKDFLQILSPDDYEAYIPEDFSCKVLVKNKQALLNQFQDLVMDRATLEDFMLFSTKGVLPCQD